MDISKEHYQEFSKLFGKETSEINRPSLKFSLESTEADKVNKDFLVAQRVRDVIKCSNCSRPRCIFAAAKLSYNQSLRLRQLKDDNIYVCGVSLFPEKSQYQVNIVVRKSMSCSLSPVEAVYYSTKNISFPDVCFHCESATTLCNNDLIRELKCQFARVRPISMSCINAGKEPNTWEPNNLTKKKK